MDKFINNTWLIQKQKPIFKKYLHSQNLGSNLKVYLIFYSTHMIEGHYEILYRCNASLLLSCLNLIFLNKGIFVENID